MYCICSTDQAWKFNEERHGVDAIAANEVNADEAVKLNNSDVAYTKQMFDALILRYEEPIANNRWDSPLFTILPETDLNTTDIHAALFERKPPPPNLSTQNVSNTQLTDDDMKQYF